MINAAQSELTNEEMAEVYGGLNRCAGAHYKEVVSEMWR